MRSVSIVGCGWLGLPLAQHLQQQGWPVRGCSRKEETLAQLKRDGIPGFELSLGHQLQCDDLEGLLDAEVLIVNVPPGRIDGDASYPHRMGLLAEAARDHRIERVIFVSATSVYAPGDDVDERSTLDIGPRATAMLEAEQQFDKAFGQSLTILRPSGLVGGQRHPGRFLAGRKSVPGADSVINLVHRDDVMGAIQQVIEHDAWGQCFNLSAPQHPTRQAFYSKVTVQLGLEPPAFSAEPQANKCINGNRICRELDFQYRFEDPFDMPLEEPG